MTALFNPLTDPALESPIVAALDIETFDVTPTATIASVGAVFFNILTGQRYGTFYERVVHEGQARSTDQGTLEFWQAQQKDSPLAYAELFDPTLSRAPLDMVLTRFNAKVDELSAHPDAAGKKLHVMGNGCDFDNTIVLNAMRQYGIVPTWRFRDNQHLRSFVCMGRLLLGIDPKYNLPFHGIKHHALDDAEHEARYLLSIMGSFMQRLGLTPAH